MFFFLVAAHVLCQLFCKFWCIHCKHPFVSGHTHNTHKHNQWWLGGLVARALDLRLNGCEFETRRPLVLLGSKLGQLTHTYWPSRSQWSSTGIPGCGWETTVSALITTTTVIRSLGHGLQHLSCSARSTQPSTFHRMIKWVLVNARVKSGESPLPGGR